MKIDTYNHQNGNNFGTLQYVAIGMENKMFLKRMEGLDESHRPKTCGNGRRVAGNRFPLPQCFGSVSLALADQIDKALITLGGYSGCAAESEADGIGAADALAL